MTRIIEQGRYIAQRTAKTREQFALEKYEALSEDDRAIIDKQIELLSQHFRKHNFKPEPSRIYKLDLIMVVGTCLNEKKE